MKNCIFIPTSCLVNWDIDNKKTEYTYTTKMQILYITVHIITVYRYSAAVLAPRLLSKLRKQHGIFFDNAFLVESHCFPNNFEI